MTALIATLSLGFLFGLRHATEADHIAAVSSIVSEHGNMRRALRIGGLWGAGHTISILAAGLFVLALHLAIPDPVARGLEFLVAVMITGLGATSLWRALRRRPDFHLHAHSHGPGATARHRHVHFHEPGRGHSPAGHAAAADHDHSQARIGWKPLLVGMMHGLAGSAALTLLVLSRIASFWLGMAYLLVFGLGSIGGMALMSLLIGLPFAASAGSPRWNRALRVATGAASLAFGLFYAWSQFTASGGAAVFGAA